jgi:hypothetical protein
MDHVGDEAVAFGQGQTSINPLMSDSDHRVLCEEVNKLAAANLEQSVPDFIDKRRAFAAETREDQKSHFEGRPELKEHLLKVAEADLPNWLPAETITASGCTKGNKGLIVNSKPFLAARRFASLAPSHD